MEWISVEDKLPEDGQKVLFSRFNEKGVYCGDYLFNRGFASQGRDYYYITHWMPLPEPPKPEQG